MIAIHNTKNSFSDRWIQYCKDLDIPYKVVSCYDSNLIENLSDCSALMWHHSQTNPKDIIIAKSILFALQHAGKIVFPDFETAWHFDDKLGQKYLLEAIGAPLVKTYTFYDNEQALDFAKHTSYPKVFKLRRGAGSYNVRLVMSYNEAKKLIDKSFTSGFSNFDAQGAFKDILYKRMQGKVDTVALLKSALRIFIKPRFSKIAGRECDYVYFQEFIPDNAFDIRVVVVGERAFAIKRLVRQNDFRASGSGNLVYEKENFDKTTLGIAFSVANKIRSQAVAFDFVYMNGNPLIVEISYGYTKEAYDKCDGYWDDKLQWHGGTFNPCGWMVDDLLRRIDG
jgi:glutathione synthase/RimK-type ligase-like ATP-grasp enzyme